MRDLLRPVPGDLARRCHRFRPVALACLLPLLTPSISAADVSASIDRSAISLNETVQLVLESDGESGSRPDLSVLTPDFEILNRRVRRNVSVFNGQRSERYVLILWLRPHRSGELEIPPIPFGNTATDALQLSVAAPSTGAFRPPVTNQPDMGADKSAPPFAAPARRSWQRPPQADEPEKAIETAMPPKTLRDDAAAPSRLWVWIAAAFALVWIATMIGWWRSKQRPIEAASTPAPLVPMEPPPSIDETEPLAREIDAVQTAYEVGDAGAAREALLTWAGQALPEQTPSNLARLAQRCPQPLRGQILLLEQAFFSPSPVAWDKQPVWEGLKDFVPQSPEEPASFRRGKPILRRAANPDAE